VYSLAAREREGASTACASGVAILAMVAPLAACSRSDEAGPDDSIIAGAPSGDSDSDVVEATSGNGVVVAVGLSCSEEGDPFMLIGARGLTGDAEYVANVVPELSFELRAVAQPDGTFMMQNFPDPDVSSATITLATIGSGVTLELPGCAS
jgi:hypothetical protein